MDRKAVPTIPGMANLPPPPEDAGEDEVVGEDDGIVVHNGRRFRRIDANDWFDAYAQGREAESVRRCGRTTGGSAGGMAVDHPYHEPSGAGSMPQRKGYRKHSRR